MYVMLPLDTVWLVERDGKQVGHSSLGFVLIRLLRGLLPWQGVDSVLYAPAQIGGNLQRDSCMTWGMSGGELLSVQIVR